MPQVTGQIIPLGTGFPVAASSRIAGASFPVATIGSRNAIVESSRVVGMSVYVVETGKTYRLLGGTSNDNWVEVPTAEQAEFTSNRAKEISLSEYTLYDDFQRANVAPGGNLGAPLTGGGDWQVLGIAGVVPSTQVYLDDGKLKFQADSSKYHLAYLVREFEYPATVMGAEISFEDKTGTGSATTAFCMSFTTKASGSWVSNLIHCLISEYGLVIEVGSTTVPGDELRQIAKTSFTAGTVVRGRKYTVELMVDGSLCILRMDRFYCVAFDPEISRNHGRYGYWEWYNQLESSTNQLFIHSVWTKRTAIAPSRDVIKTGFAPVPVQPGMHFAGAGARATANLTGLANLGTSDFSVWWRGRFPASLYHVRLGAGNILGLWAFGSRSDGVNDGTGPRLELENYSLGGNLTYDVRLGFILQAASEYRKLFYSADYPAQSFNRVVDLCAIRRGNTAELYGDGALQASWPEQVSANPPGWNAPVNSSYLHVGHCDATYNRGWRGEIYQCGLANVALAGTDIVALQRGIIPERLKWATNAPLAPAQEMIVGKCYRIGAVGTPNYWYTGCAEGDEIWVISETLAVAYRATHIVGPGAYSVTLNTLAANASNTATQLGFMVFLDAQRAQVFIDLSSNAVPVATTGPVVSTGEPVAARVLFGVEEPNGNVVGEARGQTYIRTNSVGTVKLGTFTFNGIPGTTDGWI